VNLTLSPDASPSCLSEDEALRYVSSNESSAPDLALQEHLDSCAPCRMMIAEAARAMSESGPASSRTADLPAPAAHPLHRGAPTSLAIGEALLDRYTIAGFVARGGMGEVYEAYDAVLRETVALKTLICTDLDRPAAVQRLMAEVRLARQVTHPNVCRIYEFGMHQPEGRPGRDAEPIPFLTMEFLRGESLDRRLARLGPFPAAEVARLIPQLTAGLGAIHAAGIVHRDIKPGNISLLPGPPERLVLMDLGLARTTGPVESGSLSGGRLTGTLDYMAPEQVRGLPATSAMDIYALGLVIFEMLTGRRPFDRADALASAVARMVRPAPRPTQLIEGLDPAWDVLMARCLAPDPERRFASVEDLAAFVAANLARNRRDGTKLRTALLARASAALRPGVAAAVALATLAVVGAGLFGISWARRNDTGTSRGAASAVAAVQPPVRSSGPWGRVRPPQIRAQRSFLASGCSADMVRVADRFCIDRYEASIVDDLEQRTASPYYPPSPDLVTKVLEDWNRKVEGGTTGLPMPLPDLPAWQKQIGWRPRAVSQPEVLPQGYASQIIAAVACASAGKRLCTTEEWLTACRGERRTKFPYGDTYQEGVCNVHRAEREHPAHMLNLDYTDGLLDPRMNQMSSEQTGPLLRPTGGTPGCASRWGDDAVYDMVGNLDEWSADPNGVMLGGFYLRQTQDGCDYANTRHPPDFFNYSIGIRCCDRLH
jgi:serine/threonine protein kinase/formylglycine-generating enzyme required for sulfatase activity